MTATEKLILYRFFKTSADYLRGYALSEEEPVFVDTEIAPAEAAQQDAAPAQNPSTEPHVLFQQAGQDSRFSTMADIAQAVHACRGCGLAATRIHAVPGEGPEELSRLQNSVEVMVIGEGPGADEDKTGRPFVGKAGQLLDKMLEAIQLSRKTNCYITNIVKCRPPQNRDPAPAECAACAQFLEAQIRLQKPLAILVFGRCAAQLLLNTTEGIGKLRGRFFDYNGIPLLATYHPSALLRDESLKRPAWEDLKKFRTQLLQLRAERV
ncbi:uracil-DNA glycosylase [Treponema phagedenis]|uniref:uracil-DNA glycosylase n=1 Tax=Treponema phagedenis TaxID=162 RepID=UPI0001F642DC|nr:uracil-DNA glycosylase [Treponema phagedenis]EFW38933.1 uracil-DNA glycosylase, family 4 [Treponema phagedenis F0421]NVP22981.1 uracil-DNA glycosylase [Treponema phagedenis]QEJ95103.1 uracil-DNA glycosylase [Treponema phagedenis]QEK09350.1 uracil-DNA glycosylase [Treponema phagedenis]QKS92354.1 uracil-DNA glycosylase [Treponema phagedenis]